MIWPPSAGRFHPVCMFDAHLAIASAIQKGAKIVNRNEMAQGIRNVGVDARPAVQQEAPEGALRVKVA